MDVSQQIAELETRARQVSCWGACLGTCCLLLAAMMPGHAAGVVCSDDGSEQAIMMLLIGCMPCTCSM